MKGTTSSQWSSSQTGDTPSPSSLACCGHSVLDDRDRAALFSVLIGFFDETPSQQQLPT